MRKCSDPTLHNVHVSCIYPSPTPRKKNIYNDGVQDIGIFCSLYLMMSIYIILNKYSVQKYISRNA